MAIGYGLGIGLQAKPKDYVEILKAREAATQKANAAKAAKAAQQQQRSQDAFIRNMGSKNALPVQRALLDNIVTEFYDMIDEESTNDTPNYNKINEYTTRAMLQANQYAENYKSWQKISQNAVKFGLTDTEVQAINQIEDPTEFATAITKSGSGLVSFDPNTRALSIEPIADYAPVGELISGYVKKKGDLIRADSPYKTNKVTGGTESLFRIKPESADDFVAETINLASTDRDLRVFYRENNMLDKLPQIGTPEYLRTKTDYLKQQYNAATKDLTVQEMYRSPSNYSTTIINTPETKQGGVAVIGEQTYNYGYGSDGFTTYGNYPGGTTQSVSGVRKGTRNLETLQPIKSEAGTFSSGNLYVAPVFNVPLNTNQKDKAGNLITYEVGEIIPNSLLQMSKDKGWVKYELVGIGEFTPSGSTAKQPAQVFDQTVINNWYNTADKAEKERLNQELKRLQGTIKSKSSGASSRGEF